MDTIGEVVFNDTKREPIISCEKISDDVIKFSTKMNDFIYRPLSEEERQWQIDHPSNLICLTHHTFCVIKDGKEFIAEDVSHIVLNRHWLD